MSDQTISITGAAGFIGFHVTRRLLSDGRDVVGLDNLNAYYDPQLKEARLERLRADPRFTFVQADLADRAGGGRAVRQTSFRGGGAFRRAGRRALFHRTSGCLYRRQFAASAMCWKDIGTINAVICFTRRRPRSMAPIPRCHFRRRQHRSTRQLLRRDQEGERDDGLLVKPSLPSAGHRLAVLYRLRIGGPARHGYFLFTKAIVEGRAIKLFNHGRMRKDFTHTNNACRIVLRLTDHVPLAGPAGAAPARIYNIGSQHPGVDVVALLEKQLEPYRGKGYAADAAR
jgi:UDP-glucuronate 4-epimerase